MLKWFKQKNIGKGFAAFLALQLAIVLFFTVTSLHPKQHIIFDDDDFIVNDENVPVTSLENGGYFMANDPLETGEAVLTSHKFSLHPGSYRLKVNYVSRSYTLTNMIDSLRDSTGYIDLLNRVDDKNYVNFEEFILRDGREQAEISFRITDWFPVEELSFQNVFTGGGTLEFYSLEVEEIMIYRVLKILFIALGFLAADIIIYLVFISEKFDRKKELAILALICIWSILPYLDKFSVGVHDIAFHINRIGGLVEEIKAGNWYPYIYNSALNGHGYINPVFYCQVPLYIPAILNICGFSMGFCYNAYLCIVTVGTCIIMYCCTNKIFKKSNIALLATAMYTMSVYRLTNIFMRAAVGEYTGMMFLPLIVLGFYNVYTAPKGEYISFKKLLPLIIGLCGLMFHVLSIVMSAMLITVFCLIKYEKTFEPKRFVSLAFAAITTFLMNLYIIVPMLDCMSMDLIVHDGVEVIQEKGANIASLFNPMIDAHIYEGTMPGVDMSMTVGFSIVLGLLFFLLLVIKKKEFINEENFASYKIAKYSFGFTAVSLFLSTKYFPYDAFESLGDAIYSIMIIYQFPWRWLTFATLFGVICTVAVVDCLKEYKICGTVALEVLVVAALLINSGNYIMDSYAEGYYNILSDDPANYTINVGMGEYLVKDTKFYEYETLMKWTHLIYSKEDITVNGYRFENGVAKLSVKNNREVDSYVDIPRNYYKYYVAQDDATGEYLGLVPGENNRIRVVFPAGYEGSVQVIFYIKTIWKLAMAASLITAALLAVAVVWIYCFKDRSRKKQI